MRFEKKYIRVSILKSSTSTALKKFENFIGYCWGKERTEEKGKTEYAQGMHNLQ